MFFQLIAYATIIITTRGTTVPIYELAAKQPKKEHKLGVRNFLSRLSTSKDEPVKSTETRNGVKTQEDYPATEKSW